jgi:hypothetical protein
MIYFTTFILTLILSHIVRATPACGDVAPPEELYEDPTYADYADGQQILPNPFFNVTWSSLYDTNGDTNKVACNNGPHGLAHTYPHFKSFPSFPFIGGAYNVKHGSPFCGSCWNLTSVRTRRWILVTLINSAQPGHYNISKEAFIVLNGGNLGSSLTALPREISPKPCGVL